MKPVGGHGAPRADSVRTGPGLRARTIALQILIAVEDGGYADVLLGTRISDLDPVDRRLVTRLVLGTLAWRARLDFELAHLCGRRLSALDSDALQILRMGLFQLRFLDRIPHHAAVSTAVEMAKRGRNTKAAAGLVNAVMRRATRETIELPQRETDEIGWLALSYSHPRWIVEQLVRQFGIPDAEHLMAANNEAAPNVLRINLARTSRVRILEQLVREGFEVSDDTRAPETVILRSAPRFDSESYRTGLFVTQSEASQLVSRMLAPRRGATVVDCAAAPGGKSAHLAELVGPDGRVLALDLNFAGLKTTRSQSARLGHRNVECIRADATSGLPLRSRSFEYVLLDAPCTGLGTLREHPEIRWRLKRTDPVRMAVIQSAMLEMTGSLVAPGCTLLYSVCSIADEEGAGVVRNFVSDHPEFTIDGKPPNQSEVADLIDVDGFLRTRPDRGGLDGFFAARLIRRG